jgi:excisionase family DNA binding protein
LSNQEKQQTDGEKGEKPKKSRRGRALAHGDGRANNGRVLMSTIVITVVAKPLRADGLYSVKEVAAMLGVHWKSVWRWVTAGKLPAYRLRGEVGAPIRISGRAVMALRKKYEKIKSGQPTK